MSDLIRFVDVNIDEEKAKVEAMKLTNRELASLIEFPKQPIVRALYEILVDEYLAREQGGCW